MRDVHDKAISIARGIYGVGPGGSYQYHARDLEAWLPLIGEDVCWLSGGCLAVVTYSPTSAAHFFTIRYGGADRDVLVSDIEPVP